MLEAVLTLNNFFDSKMRFIYKSSIAVNEFKLMGGEGRDKREI
jgi:hypothetical protein